MENSKSESVSVPEGTQGETPSLMTRREALSTIVRVSAAGLPLVTAAGLSAAQVQPPRNLRIVTPTSGGPILAPGDLRFMGFIRFPGSSGDLWYNRSAYTMRWVAGEPRVLMLGNETEGNHLLEFALPSALPSTDLASSPYCTQLKDWGSVMAGRMLTGGSAGAWCGGIHWDDRWNAVYWTYGDGYVPTQSHPTVGATLLESAGARSFGPWRTEWTSQRTRGAMTKVPAAFAAAYTGGKQTGLMSSQSSGNGTSPFGANLSAVDLPDPVRTPADSTTNTHWTIANHGLILHDIDHRQTRDTRYKTCSWNVKYDCRLGSEVQQGPPIFGGVDTGSGQDDSMLSCVWIDLPDKQGFVHFGQLVTTPAGYKAPGDPDGFVHMWYGDPYRSDGSKAQHCCHGQDDPWWGATGPGAHYRVPMVWIYNPSDLIETAQRRADLWTRKPTSTFELKQVVPSLDARYGSGMIGGAVFDPGSRRLYVLHAKQDRLTHPPHGRPAIMVFEIR